MSTPAPTTAAEQSRPTEGTFTLGQRIALFFITWAAFLAIRLIGPTLRFEVSIEDGGPPLERMHPAIKVFWHRCVFPATWWYRKRGIHVMTSSSFDGEYIARIIEKFGFGAVRGSSTRGAVRALLGMHKIIEQDNSVAFTIDGPKGPAYVAKPGPVLLARNTGVPIYCFHIAVARAWVLNSWDRFIVPKPFSRAVLRVGKLIAVPRDATSEQIQSFHEQMQATLDRIRIAAEERMVEVAGKNA
ncbi:MAG: lysophospholipid acyltransferase family protein [Terriglobales bacterium]